MKETKSIIVIILLILLSSCMLLNTSDCNENLEFKKKYFECIRNIEDYFFHKSDSVDTKTYLQSLTRMSVYVPYDFSEWGSYVLTYNSVADFLKEKEKWLKWYEKNKCKNLQWIEPEHYPPQIWTDTIENTSD